MATGAQALPGPSDQGPSGTGGQASPAPAQGQGSGKMLDLVRQVVSATRVIGQMVPGAVPEVRQINDLIQKVQMKILQAQPPQEPQAPPL